MRTIVSVLVLAALALLLAACKPNAAAVSSAATASPAAPSAGAGVSTPESAGAGAARLFDALFAKAGFETPSAQIMSTDFTLDSLEGKKVRLTSFRGKVVVLSFWATWCVPCQEEMPAMQKLYESLRGRGLEIVAVDVMEEKAKVAQFRKEHGYSFPILLDTVGNVAGLYGAQGLPTNYVIDGEGRVLARVVGVGGPSWTSAEMKLLFEHLLMS